MGISGSMKIYYSGNQYPDYYFEAWCTRWDEGNYDVVIETFLESSNRNTLFAHVTPGSIRDLMENNPIGLHYFIDTTYKSGNTLIFEPIHNYGLSSLRESRMIGIKSVQDTFLTPDKFHVKIEGVRLGKFGF